MLLNRNLLVISLTCFIFGCAATKLDFPGKDVVVIPSTQQLPKDCKFLAQVIGNQGNFFTGAWTSNANMAVGAMNDMRNKAYELGANYVQMLTNQASITGSDGLVGGSIQQTNVTNIGNAYKCEN